MFNKLIEFFKSLENVQIEANRKKVLQPLIQYVQNELNNGATPSLNFICTHNSRRSQMAQVLAKAAAEFYHVKVNCFSGGTEATAFNQNAINAIQNLGFKIKQTKDANPIVTVYISDNESITCFSKVYNDLSNPKSDFAAVMTCSDADQNCPVVFGAKSRIPVTYNDPKASDGSGNEAQVYSERARQIATEMLYVLRSINSNH